MATTDTNAQAQQTTNQQQSSNQSNPQGHTNLDNSSSPPELIPLDQNLLVIEQKGVDRSVMSEVQQKLSALQISSEQKHNRTDTLKEK